MDACSKNSNNLFYKTPMDASRWIKQDDIEKLVVEAKRHWCHIIEHKSCNGHV